MGASNELPESEELDALFDRFLLRRHVSQVSSAQLASLARLAAGSLARQQAAATNGNGNGGSVASAAASSPLTLEDFKCASSMPVHLKGLVLLVATLTRKFAWCLVCGF